MMSLVVGESVIAGPKAERSRVEPDNLAPLPEGSQKLYEE
jgi:hypothetical protein